MCIGAAALEGDGVPCFVPRSIDQRARRSRAVRRRRRRPSPANETASHTCRESRAPARNPHDPDTSIRPLSTQTSTVQRSQSDQSKATWPPRSRLSPFLSLSRPPAKQNEPQPTPALDQAEMADTAAAPAPQAEPAQDEQQQNNQEQVRRFAADADRPPSSSSPRAARSTSLRLTLPLLPSETSTNNKQTKNRSSPRGTSPAAPTARSTTTSSSPSSAAHP